MTDEKRELDLDALGELERKAFCAPWTYSEWEIECETCAKGGDCDNPECDGSHVPCTTIESPDEYPDGQIVAQFVVPGLSELADRNGAFIVALRNAAPQLMAATRETAALRARVAVLEEALRPFAACYTAGPYKASELLGGLSDDGEDGVSHLRQAAAALKASRGDES